MATHYGSSNYNSNLNSAQRKEPPATQGDLLAWKRRMLTAALATANPCAAGNKALKKAEVGNNSEALAMDIRLARYGFCTYRARFANLS